MSLSGPAVEVNKRKEKDLIQRLCSLHFIKLFWQETQPVQNYTLSLLFTFTVKRKINSPSKQTLVQVIHFSNIGLESLLLVGFALLGTFCKLCECDNR